MEKIKSILSPGHSKDDQAMYGTEAEQPTADTKGATGKVTGQGSHFTSGNASTNTTTQPYSGTASSASGIFAPSSGPQPASRPAMRDDMGAGSIKPGEPGCELEHPKLTSAVGNDTSGNMDLSSSGPAPTTAGPDSSDPVNKTDPRVHSDMSKSAGVPAGSANTAASAAWPGNQSSVPGSYPQEDMSNPHAANNLDPRVDSIPRQDVTATTSYPSTTATTQQGTGLGERGSQDFYGSQTGSTGVSSSTTGTSQPMTSGLPTNPATSSTTAPTISSTTEPITESGSKGAVASMLGAVGLGALASKMSSDTTQDTTTEPWRTTGTDLSTSPSQSGAGIPSHHRRESIPTTAYPSGTLDSPRAQAPPTGTAVGDETAGTGRATIGQTSTYGSYPLASGQPTSSVVDPTSSDPTTYQKPETSHLGRDTALGAGAGATGVAAASALGHRDQTGTQSSLPLGSTGAAQSGTDHDLTTSSSPQTGANTTGTSYTRDTAPSATTATTIGAGDHHYDRDAALGTGAGAAGVGAYEHEKSHRDIKEEKKEQIVYAKEAEKEQKQAEKAAAKEERREEKAAVREESREEKAVAKEEKREEKRLHKEEAGAGVGAADVGASEYEHEKLRHGDTHYTGPHTTVEEKEHKPSLIQRILHPRRSSKAAQDYEVEGAGAVGGLPAADAVDRARYSESATGGLEAAKDRVGGAVAPEGRYADPPTKGHAAKVTGGTGTTALAQGGGGPTGSYATAFGNGLDGRDTPTKGSVPAVPTEEGIGTSGMPRREVPTKGYAAQVTGSSGTTALAGAPSGRTIGEQGELTGGNMSKLDSNTTGAEYGTERATGAGMGTHSGTTGTGIGDTTGTTGAHGGPGTHGTY